MTCYLRQSWAATPFNLCPERPNHLHQLSSSSATQNLATVRRSSFFSIFNVGISMMLSIKSIVILVLIPKMLSGELLKQSVALNLPKQNSQNSKSKLKYLKKKLASNNNLRFKCSPKTTTNFDRSYLRWMSVLTTCMINNGGTTWGCCHSRRIRRKLTIKST